MHYEYRLKQVSTQNRQNLENFKLKQQYRDEIEEKKHLVGWSCFKAQ